MRGMEPSWMEFDNDVKIVVGKSITKPSAPKGGARGGWPESKDFLSYFGH